MKHKTLHLYIEKGIENEQYMKLLDTVKQWEIPNDSHIHYWLKREMRLIWKYKVAGIFLLLIEIKKRVKVYTYPTDLIMRFPYTSYLLDLLPINPLMYQYDLEIISAQFKKTLFKPYFTIVIKEQDVIKIDALFNLFNIKISDEEDLKIKETIWRPICCQDMFFPDSSDTDYWIDWLHAGIFDFWDLNGLVNDFIDARSVKQIYKIVTTNQRCNLTDSEIILVTLLIAFFFNTPRITIQYTDDFEDATMYILPNLSDDDFD